MAHYSPNVMKVSPPTLLDIVGKKGINKKGSNLTKGAGSSFSALLGSASEKALKASKSLEPPPTAENSKSETKGATSKPNADSNTQDSSSQNSVSLQSGTLGQSIFVLPNPLTSSIFGKNALTGVNQTVSSVASLDKISQAQVSGSDQLLQSTTPGGQPRSGLTASSMGLPTDPNVEIKSITNLSGKTDGLPGTFQNLDGLAKAAQNSSEASEDPTLPAPDALGELQPVQNSKGGPDSNVANAALTSDPAIEGFQTSAPTTPLPADLTDSKLAAKSSINSVGATSAIATARPASTSKSGQEQNFGQPQPQAQAQLTTNAIAKPSELSASQNIDRHALVNQVANKLEMLHAANPKGGIKIELAPQSLGSITVTLKSVGKELDAQIVASNPGVHSALQQSQPDLANAMTAKGYTLSNLNVTADASSGFGGEKSSANPQGASSSPNSNLSQQFSDPKPEANASVRVSSLSGTDSVDVRI